MMYLPVGGSLAAGEFFSTALHKVDSHGVPIVKICAKLRQFLSRLRTKGHGRKTASCPYDRRL